MQGGGSYSSVRPAASGPCAAQRSPFAEPPPASTVSASPDIEAGGAGPMGPGGLGSGPAGGGGQQVAAMQVVLSLKVMVAAGSVCAFHVGGGQESAAVDDTSGVPVSWRFGCRGCQCHPFLSLAGRHRSMGHPASLYRPCLTCYLATCPPRCGAALGVLHRRSAATFGRARPQAPPAHCAAAGDRALRCIWWVGGHLACLLCLPAVPRIQACLCPCRVCTPVVQVMRLNSWPSVIPMPLPAQARPCCLPRLQN